MSRSTTRIVATLVLATALVAFASAWLMTSRDAPPALPATTTEQNAIVTSELGDAVRSKNSAEAASVTEPNRTNATAGTNAVTTGSLLLHALWGDDKQPAALVPIALHRSNSSELEDVELRTNAAGEARAAELPPGKFYATIQQGGHSGGQSFSIKAGECTELTITLEVGMNCRGRVVDELGAAVADADIVITGWGGGPTTTLTASAADGTFALRGVATHCHIGARKWGYVPSSLRQFTASEGATVDFSIVLARGGAALQGVVLGPQGTPINNAILRAGSLEQGTHTLADGASAMAPQAELTRTDEHGRFAFASVPVGTVPLAARAPGLALWQQDIVIAAGAREEVTIHLLAGATVFGTVRDQAGSALAKVEIRAGDWQDFGAPRVRTAEDGAFRIEGLPPGQVRFHVSDDDRGKLEQTLALANGEQQRWDPVLVAGLQLRGRVVDANDKPVQHCMVEARLENSRDGDDWWGFENTDAEGRFTLKNCVTERTIGITFRRKSMFPELRLEGVVPSGEELLVKLPAEAWCYLQGTVLGPDDTALPNVHISPYMQGGNGSPAETADGKTGAFRYGPYPPGVYSLTLSADGFPTIRFGERVLGPNEVWDLGTIHFQPGGTLIAQLLGDTESLSQSVTLTVLDDTGKFCDRLSTKDGLAHSSPLAAGSYMLQTSGEALAAQTHAFVIRARQETRLDLPIRVGVQTTIRCTLPATTNVPGVDLVVSNGRGEVVFRGSAWKGTDGLFSTFGLAPGEYAVLATAGGLRGEGQLVVSTAPATLDLVLR